MLMISSRKKFSNSDKLTGSADDSIKEVDIHNFIFGDDVQNSTFLNKLDGKRVILLIHGYNNDIFDVMRAYAILETKITTNLNDHYDMVVGYTWPGGDDKFEYSSAKSRTTLIGPRLSRLISRMSTVVRSLDFMTHSMGAHVIFKALQHQSTGKIRHHFAMASAVDNEAIEREERYYNSSNALKYNFIFHSKNDGVLGLAYRLAEWDRALGYSGPEDPANTDDNVKIINCKRVISHHGGYKYSAEVFGFIHSALNDDPMRISKFNRLR